MSARSLPLSQDLRGNTGCHTRSKSCDVRRNRVLRKPVPRSERWSGTHRPRRRDRTTSRPTRAIGSWRQCATSAPTPRSCRFSGVAQIETPVEIINGRRDAVVPPVNAEYLHARVPRAKLDLIDAGHFICENAADEYAAIVTAWWDTGYRTVRGRCSAGYAV